MTKETFKRGCVVTLKVKGEDRSQSGILIDSDRGLVVTHGTLLASFISDTHLKSLTKAGYLVDCFDAWKSHIVLEKCSNYPERHNTIVTSNLNSGDLSHTLHSNFDNKQRRKNVPYLKFSGKILSIFTIRKLQNVINQIISPNDNWEFYDENITHSLPEDQKQIRTLLPSFILIRLDNFQGYNDPLKVLPYSFIIKGDPLEVEGTPFGGLNPDIFLNHLSSGIVSNKAGGILLMTDARCVPGTDGGPVFCWKRDQRFLAGIVITSLCWKSNEWVGLSLICSISEVLKHADQVIKTRKIYTEPNTRVTRSKLSELTNAVPMVLVGSNWGSGVVIGWKNKSYLLTCSHVVKGFEYSNVRVKFSKDRIEKGHMIYKTSLDEQYDIALLSISQNATCSIPMATKTVMKGDRVYVIGHAIFGEDKSLDATITAGIVSKVVYVGNVAAMVQTTCAVHAGASGGAVINQEGQLIGIPVSNAKDIGTKALYPHINMCVPIATIAPYLQHYMETEDVEVLQNLTVSNQAIKTLWTLGQTQKASRL